MTTTPPEAPGAPPPGHEPGPSDTSGHGPRVGSETMRDLSLLRRSRTDRHVAGVAGGLGRHLDIDPIILRVAFVVLSFFGGAGLLLYAAAWLLVPEEGDDNGRFDVDPRTRGVALIGVGILGGLLVIGDAWGGPGWFPWPLLVVGLIAWLVIRNRERRAERRAAAYGQWYGQEYGQTYAGYPGGTSYDAPAAAAAGDGTTTPAGAPVPPGPAPRPWTPRPPDPRKRGPKLFWFTMALVALGLGILGTVDLAGVGVTDSAYPALALGIIAVMLLTSAFYGRGGGLILVGFVALFGLVAATATDRYDGERVEERPTSAAAVEEEYSNPTGELVLDLRGVADVEGLDGRTVEVDGGVGRIEVVVPDGVDVVAYAEVDGPGHISLFDEERGGIEVRDSARLDGGADAPELRIDVSIGVGEIEVSER